jgi:hypothetical protein
MADMVDITCDILHKTHDGNDLHGYDLKLIEDAVNGFLNKSGIAKVNELHQIVMDGRYVIGKRWIE